MSVAAELRALADEPPTIATVIRLIELSIVVEQMERQLGEAEDADARENTPLETLIRWCNAGS